MENLIINFDEFELPFSTKASEEEAEETSESDAEMKDGEELDVYEVCNTPYLLDQKLALLS